jgi:hypothetical protein
VADAGAAVAHERVGVERDHDAGLAEVVERLEHLAEGELGAGARVVAGEGVVAVDLDAGQRRLERGERARRGGRAVRLGQDGQALAARGLGLVGEGAHGGERVVPGAVLPLLRRPGRAVRVVHVEHVGLDEGVGAAQALGVLGVALDLGGPALVALDEHADRGAVPRQGGGEEERHARDHLLGLLRVGQDALVGAAAGRDAGERQRGAHVLEEVTPRNAVGRLGRAVGELARELFLERRQLSLFAQAPPVLLAGVAFELGVRKSLRHRVLASAQRWQPEQCVGG